MKDNPVNRQFCIVHWDVVKSVQEVYVKRSQEVCEWKFKNSPHDHVVSIILAYMQFIDRIYVTKYSTIHK